MEFLDWMEIGEPIQSTFQRGAAMTNISMIDDNQEGAVQMISINLNNVSAEDKTKFLKAFTEDASNNLKAVYGENSIKKNMVKEIENMITKNNGIDSTDLSSIVAVYNSRGKIDYGKNLYRDFSENLYDTDKHIRSSVISPYGCMEESLRKVSKDVLGIVM